MSAHVRFRLTAERERAGYVMREGEPPRIRDHWLFWLYKSELSRG